MKKYSAYIILVPFAVGILTLTGWMFSIDVLARPPYGSITMNPMTAVCFMLCSICFFLDFKRSFNNKVSVISAGMSVSVATVGALKLLSVFGLDLHIDTWLFHDAVTAGNTHGHLSHMTPNTALGFVLMGLALRFGIVDSVRSKMICNYMALAAFIIGIFSVIGYTYHFREHHTVLSYIPMAFLTAVCFMCLSVAFLIENGDKDFVSRTLSIFQRRSKLKTSSR